MGWLRTTYVSVTWVILWLLGRPEIRRNETKERIEKRYAITSGQSYSIHWIETVLKTPIEDYRKNALALILAPYLINIKKLSYDEAFSIIKYGYRNVMNYNLWIPILIIGLKVQLDTLQRRTINYIRY